MEIGFDAKRAFNNFTGLGNYSRFIIQALQDHHPENKYHLFTPKISDHPESLSLKKLSTTHTPTGFYNRSVLKAYWRSFKLSELAENENLDIYHGLSNELPFKITKRIKSVVTIHDLIFLRFPKLFPFIDRAIYRKKFIHACQNADIVIAISEQTKSDIVEFFGINPNKIRVVYQGVHPNFYNQYSDEQKKEIKTKYNLPTDYLLFVGTIEERKNALLILKSLHKGNIDMPVVIVGKKTSYFEVLKEYIEKHKIQDKVIFLHKIDFDDLPAIYDQCSVFIYPSIFEGFGIPIIEALHRKKPVITSKGSCFKEAGGSISEYVDPYSEEELTSKINKVLKEKTTLNKENLENHLASFSAKTISDKMINIYNELI